MKGNVFDIQRFSIHDGPGVRTTVFLKNCSLKCIWCHNPEGLERKTNLRFLTNLCIGCKKCSICPNEVHKFVGNKHIVHFSLCKACGKCVNVCPSQALVLCGKEMTSAEVAKEVLKDRDYYTNGGVTFSGGEPLLQTDFIIECVKNIRKEMPNIHVAIDTCGNVHYSVFQKIFPYVDIFLYDVKAFEEKTHILGTGSSNNLIKENLLKLDKENIPIWIRIPLVPLINDNDEELTKIADFISKLNNIQRLTLIPYHSLGSNKYEEIGMEYLYDSNLTISEERFTQIKKIFSSKGLHHQP